MGILKWKLVVCDLKTSECYFQTAFATGNWLSDCDKDRLHFLNDEKRIANSKSRAYLVLFKSHESFQVLNRDLQFV